MNHHGKLDIVVADLPFCCGYCIYFKSATKRSTILFLEKQRIFLSQVWTEPAEEAGARTVPCVVLVGVGFHRDTHCQQRGNFANVQW